MVGRKRLSQFWYCHIPRRRIGIPECRKEVESELNSVFEIDDHFVP
jgi:hypothetical protein